MCDKGLFVSMLEEGTGFDILNENLNTKNTFTNTFASFLSPTHLLKGGSYEEELFEVAVKALVEFESDLSVEEK